MFGVIRQNRRRVSELEIRLFFSKTVCRYGLLTALLFAGPCIAQAPQAQGLQAMQAAAERGDIHAQVMLGKAYISGKDIKQSDDRAVFWLRRAATQGDRVGQAWLGWAYEQGRGVRKDPQRAYSWYQRSARQDYAWAEKQATRLRDSGLALGSRQRQPEPSISAAKGTDADPSAPIAAVVPSSAVTTPTVPVSGTSAAITTVKPDNGTTYLLEDGDPQIIAAQLRDWVIARLQKQMPKTMYLDRAVTVGLVLPSPPEINQWLSQGIGIRVQADLQVDGAEVRAISKPEQALRPGYPLQWSWEVQALELGKPLLDLAVRARLVIPNQVPLRVELLRLGPRVQVDESWRQRLWVLVLENRVAIGFTLMVPLFLWLGMSFAGRRKTVDR